MRQAATTKLTPGSTSIDRVTPREIPGGWMINWSICLMDGRMVRKQSQGKTKGEARSRAKAKAEELLRTSSTTWKLGSDLEEYFGKVSKPTLEKSNLRDTSRRSYTKASELLFGKCDQHRHVKSLHGHTIDSGTRVRTLESCLQEIAKFHGAETARQCQNVASKYLLGQLVRDDLLRANPLYGVKIDLKTHAKKRDDEKRGGHALSRKEYEAALAYVLAFDAKAVVPKGGRSGYPYEVRLAKLQNVVDLTLLQMTTGLRIREALTATWDDVSVDDEGVMSVAVSVERSKTHRARVVPVLDDRVAKRLTARREAAQDHGYVIGAPSDVEKPWDITNARKSVVTFYTDMADELQIELLRTARTHVWRATLNTLLVGQVPEVMRAAFFGHTTDVNRASYTDTTDVRAMVGAAKDHLGMV